ncbi:MAG: cellulase family glycosylhydrolase [Gammaproteobacteria bacterium]|nr:cellulase family glycosylhydrolase [Gammaproteobacteria bacterium]
MKNYPDRRDFLRIAAAGVLGSLFPQIATATSVLEAEAMHLVQPTFFGLHMGWPVVAPYVANFPSVPVGTWRAMLPQLHWFSLESSKGEWHFDKLDIAMRLMESRGVDVLFALGETPHWASSNRSVKGPYKYGSYAPPSHLADWENYVRTVALRYQGRIRHYELWNEPTVREVDGAKAHFTAGQLVELGQAAHRIIKEIDPQARLTSPAMVGGEKGVARMDAYLAAGGDKCTDIVSFHYYGLPEQIPQYHTALLKVMARHGLTQLPVWNTEFGYLIADPATSPDTYPIGGGSFSRILPQTEAAAWLARSLIIAASLGIERFYWFMWDGKYLGLTHFVGHKINAAGVAYGTVAGWLTGRQIGEVQRTGGVDFCLLVEHGKMIGRLIWAHDYGPMRWNIPKSWNAAGMESLDGVSRKIFPTDDIELWASPVLIRSLS